MIFVGDNEPWITRFSTRNCNAENISNAHCLSTDILTKALVYFSLDFLFKENLTSRVVGLLSQDSSLFVNTHRNTQKQRKVGLKNSRRFKKKEHLVYAFTLVSFITVFSSMNLDIFAKIRMR